VLLNTAFPSPLSWIGMIFVMGGMILHSSISHKKELPSGKEASA